MGNFGLKVSQQGYDVKTCADKEMLLHSSFKHLKIYMEGSFTGKTAGQTIATHNLGYVPIFLVYGISTNSYVMPTFLEDMVYYSSPLVNSTNLIQGATPLTSGYYYIFQEQLNQNYSPVNVQTTATSQGTQVADYGVKASKSTYDVKTATVKNLIMTSGRKAAGEEARLHIVHSITTGDLPGVAGNTTITHNLGYVPMVLWYLLLDPATRWQMVTNATDSSISITTTTTVLGLTGYTGKYACVIFKDPSF